ncbi:hypothetical protein P7C70_g7564, partial [Phenoliferia sp. Uapishka_3]
MKFTLLACASIALAAPSPLVKRSQLSFDSPSASVADLNPSDFQSIQQSIGNSLKNNFNNLADSFLPPLAEEGDSIADSPDDDATHPGKHQPHPYIIDLSQLTILEILNASLHHHHDSHSDSEHDDKNPHWKFPWPSKPPTADQLPLHRLAWLVNHSSEAQQSLSKDGITLLAPDDMALTPPHRREKHHEGVEAETIRGESEMEEEWQPVEHPFHSREMRKEIRRAQKGEGVEEGVMEYNRTAVFSKIIGYILKYHTLDTVETGWALSNHSTFPTSLHSSRDDPEPLRLHIEPSWAVLPHPYPTVKLNFYAQKRGLSVKAKNGLIHFISAPLLPPLSPLNKLFLFPQAFATLTSGVQKVGLADALLPAPSDHGDENHLNEIWQSLVDEVVKEKGPYTLFAPTNFAYSRLGPKNVALLHSPFPLSKKILKYIISYHVVPDIAFYSDYIHNASSLAPYLLSTEIDVEVDSLLLAESSTESVGDVATWPSLPNPNVPLPDSPVAHHPPTHKANVTHYILPTLLSTSGVNPNATLKVDVVSYRLFGHGPVRSVVVVLPHHEHEHAKTGCKHHHEKKDGPKPVKVWKKDVPARNGAIHIVNELLRPPVHHPEHKSEHGDTFIKGEHHGRKMSRALEELFA